VISSTVSIDIAFSKPLKAMSHNNRVFSNRLPNVASCWSKLVNSWYADDADTL